MPFIAPSHNRVACIMVGLPARGKTYVAQKVCRYLQWVGIRTQVFNVGNYRRKIAGAQTDHTFFDPGNAEASQLRLQCALEALDDMIRWFKEDNGIVAIYDATNSTRERRRMLQTRLEAEDIKVMFVESVCDDEDVVLRNIMQVKLDSPDYAQGVDTETIVADFRARIDHYQGVYETVTEEESTFVKMINVGSRVVINRIHGYLQSRVVYYLMNLHIVPRAIFFSRHGESMYNVMGKLGGDSDLSPRGRKYSEALPGLISKHLDGQNLTVWTSTMRRTIQTGQHLPYPKLQWKALDELDAGVCDGLTYEDVEQQYPEDFALRDDDKFNYRYRGGESYRDVVLRLEPVIMELERQHNILIIGHQAILRCIYAYYLNYSHEELPYIKIPLHTVLKLTPRAYGCDVEQYRFDIEAVDTYRANPKRPSSLKRVGSSRGRPSATASVTSTGSAPRPPSQLRNTAATVPLPGTMSPSVNDSPRLSKAAAPPSPAPLAISTTVQHSPSSSQSSLGSTAPVPTRFATASPLATTSPVTSQSLMAATAIVNSSLGATDGATPIGSRTPSRSCSLVNSPLPSRAASPDPSQSKLPKIDLVNGVGVTSVKPPFSFSFTDAPDSAADKLEEGEDDLAYEDTTTETTGAGAVKSFLQGIANEMPENQDFAEEINQLPSAPLSPPTIKVDGKIPDEATVPPETTNGHSNID
ncbi:Fructose-2,6-bisphosphatase [Tieghemiomyces parasiticus]|uniref:fructose-2,6-bisphosphate 2-phosphatase n=1 Tax=Tieghemiomyces parasiticus TaxID=78921 RepID=A0A9W8AG35_9FUNG|nr:Fructose-2,6-bisphosphatase [Tieghemiomyces parasiticus]